MNADSLCMVKMLLIASMTANSKRAALCAEQSPAFAAQDLVAAKDARLPPTIAASNAVIRIFDQFAADLAALRV